MFKSLQHKVLIQSPVINPAILPFLTDFDKNKGEQLLQRGEELKNCRGQGQLNFLGVITCTVFVPVTISQFLILSVASVIKSAYSHQVPFSQISNKFLSKSVKAIPKFHKISCI